MFNLLSNALKYTFDGAITIRLRDDGEQAVLEVGRHGCRGPRRPPAHLFERFHRVADQPVTQPRGHRIGLALGANCAPARRRHRGRRREGKGTHVHVCASPSAPPTCPRIRSTPTRRWRARNRRRRPTWARPSAGHPDDDRRRAADHRRERTPATPPAPTCWSSTTTPTARGTSRGCSAPTGGCPPRPTASAAWTASARARPDLVADRRDDARHGRQRLAAMREDRNCLAHPRADALRAGRRGVDRRWPRARADDYLVKPSPTSTGGPYPSHLELARHRERTAPTASDEMMAGLSHDMQTPIRPPRLPPASSSRPTCRSTPSGRAVRRRAGGCAGSSSSSSTSRRLEGDRCPTCSRCRCSPRRSSATSPRYATTTASTGGRGRWSRRHSATPTGSSRSCSTCAATR